MKMKDQDFWRFDEIEVGKKFIVFSYLDKKRFKEIYCTFIKINKEDAMRISNGEKEKIDIFMPVILLD